MRQHKRDACATGHRFAGRKPANVSGKPLRIWPRRLTCGVAPPARCPMVPLASAAQNRQNIRETGLFSRFVAPQTSAPLARAPRRHPTGSPPRATRKPQNTRAKRASRRTSRCEPVGSARRAHRIAKKMPNSSGKTRVVTGRSGQPVRSPPGAQGRLLPKMQQPSGKRDSFRKTTRGRRPDRIPNGARALGED